MINSNYSTLKYGNPATGSAQAYNGNGGVVHRYNVGGGGTSNRSSDNISYGTKTSSVVNPLDLSLRTIRVTPDSTDEHVNLYQQQEKMIPAPSPQNYLAGVHDRRLSEVAPNHLQHYTLNGGPFGMIQGNPAAALPPNSVSYDMFPRANSSPAMSSRFSALHPLTSDLLQRNPMFTNHATYEQFHPVAGYHGSNPNAYQIQPNIPTRVSCDGMSSLYPTPSSAAAAAVARGAKHITDLIPESKNLMNAMFSETQMMKTSTSVSTTMPSAMHSAPMQSPYMHEIQSSSFHSAFQKPVCTKECCKPAVAPPCSCCWNPTKQHAKQSSSSSSYSPMSRSGLNVPQTSHDGHKSSSIPEAHKVPNYSNYHSLPQQQPQQQQQHHTTVHKKESAILNLQNSVHRSTDQVTPTSESSANDRLLIPGVYNCDKDSKYHRVLPAKGHPIVNDSVQQTSVLKPQYYGGGGDGVKDDGKPKVDVVVNLNHTKPSLPIREKSSSASDNRLTPTYREMTKVSVQQPSSNAQQKPHPPFYNGTDKAVPFTSPSSSSCQQQSNNVISANSLTTGSASGNVSGSINSYSRTVAMDTSSNGGVSRVPPPPTCWRPPVSFPDNKSSESSRSGGGYSKNICDNNYSYQQKTNKRPVYKRPPINVDVVDDENKVSSTSDVVNTNDKTSSSSSSNGTISDNQFVKINNNVLKSGNHHHHQRIVKDAVVHQTPLHQPILDKHTQAVMDNTEYLTWVRRWHCFAGRWKNLLKDIEEDSNMMKSCDRTKFPKGWETEVAKYKVSVRVPKKIIKIPGGLDLDKIDERRRRRRSNPKSNDSESSSIVDRLVNKYKKRFARKKVLVRVRNARDDSDSDSDSEDARKETTTRRHAVVKPKSDPSKIEPTKDHRIFDRVESDSDSEETIASPSSSPSSSSDNNDESWEDVHLSSAQRRKERGSKRTSLQKRAPRKRSPLDQLVSSEGYVAESKKPKTDNLYSDSSLLGREQRALQRAMMQFTELEQTTTTTTPSSKPVKKDGDKKKKKKKKQRLKHDDVKQISKRQLRNRCVDISDKKDYEHDVVKTKSKKQNGLIRKTVTRYKKDDAYEEEMAKKAALQLATQRIQKRLRSGVIIRNNIITRVTRLRKRDVDGKQDQLDDENSAEEVESNHSEAKDDGVDLKSDKSMPTACVKQMVTRSTSITLQVQWQSQQKKRLFVLRKRRFRSGLDMINFHQRRKRRREMCLKKYGADHFKQMMEAAKVSKPKPDVPSDGPPAELKRLMINKALGETILHRASRLGYNEVVLYCLDTNSGEVNNRDNAGYTPLHECCSRGHVTIAEYLLQYGADANASAAGGIRPIHDAIENNHVEIVRLLLSYGADPTITTYSGATPLKLAKSEQMSELLKGYFADVTGESNDVSHWTFNGTIDAFDPEDWGCNVFGNLPPQDSDSEDDSIVFEVSDKPHLPTYHLQPSNTSKDIIESGNYVLLQDVLQDLKINGDAFANRYRKINVITLSRSQFTESATCSQIFPQPDISSSISNIDRVQSKIVQLIPLDNEIRDVLGIECVSVR